jgi:hypothetical protein
VSVGPAERKGRTERVRVYPSAFSMGFVRLRFKLFHQVVEGVISPSPSAFLFPTPAGNVGERDGVRVANENWAGALNAGAAAGRPALAPVVDCGAARFMGAEVNGAGAEGY